MKINISLSANDSASLKRKAQELTKDLTRYASQYANLNNKTDYESKIAIKRVIANFSKTQKLLSEIILDLDELGFEISNPKIKLD